MPACLWADRCSPSGLFPAVPAAGPSRALGAGSPAVSRLAEPPPAPEGTLTGPWPQEWGPLSSLCSKGRLTVKLGTRAPALVHPGETAAPLGLSPWDPGGGVLSVPCCVPAASPRLCPQGEAATPPTTPCPVRVQSASGSPAPPQPRSQRDVHVARHFLNRPSRTLFSEPKGGHLAKSGTH